MRASAIDQALFLRLWDVIQELAFTRPAPWSERLIDVVDAYFLRTDGWYISYIIDDAALAVDVTGVWRLGDPA